MKIDFEKAADGLLPAVIQDTKTHKVLMLGFMNREAFETTQKSGKVVFYSRSRQQLWTKGETSGNFLHVEKILLDCDSDTILIKAKPTGPVCHKGADTCFDEKNEPEDFLFKLEELIKDRKANTKDDSYTSKLFAEGLNKIAQKVGEEAVELIIEAKDNNRDRIKEEAADLLYHFLVLLHATELEISDVIMTLKRRRQS